MNYVLGVDLGGTNIAAGLVDGEGNLLRKTGVPTNAPRPAEALCDDMAALCRELLDAERVPVGRVACVGVGSPGILCDGTIEYANNLALRDAPITGPLQERLGIPAFLHGDGDAAAYGESVAGAAKGCHSLVMVTLGTGIGGGLILDGKIQTGFNGAASELGHITLYPDGRPCTCGHRGCFEAYCSATGLIHSTRTAMEEHPDSGMWRLCPTPEQVDGKTAFLAARDGDSAAAAVVERYLSDLSWGLSSVVNLLQPEVLCIGGGIAKEGDPLLLPLREKLARMTFSGRQGKRTRVLTARLGNNAGIIGAAMLGLNECGRSVTRT